MPTSWAKTETSATAWGETTATPAVLAAKPGIGNTWPGDWRVLQGYTWAELSLFSWAQLSGQSGWSTVEAPTTPWGVATGSSATWAVTE